jgi:ribosome biogenesis GTPase A
MARSRSGRDSEKQARASGSSSSGGESKKKRKQKPKQKSSSSGSRNASPRTPFQHIQNLIKWVDLVIEVIDARLPDSTRHPNADAIFGHKPRLFIFTKEDLADPDKLRAVLDRIDVPSALLSLKRSSGKEKIINMAIEATRAQQEALVRKGILPRPMRICIVGLPNVGKSSLINWLIGRKKTKTGNRPGITQGTQWVRVHPKLELLDTPGILPPTGFSELTRDKLAALNLLPQSNYEVEPVAEAVLHLLKESYPELLERYMEGLKDAEDGFGFFAGKRNLLSQGAVPDRLRACSIFLSELRDGKVGRLTLD